jgi:hypothetical protein
MEHSIHAHTSATFTTTNHTSIHKRRILGATGDLSFQCHASLQIVEEHLPRTNALHAPT